MRSQLGLGLTATWLICDWPPPRLILKYGLPPAGGPTGRSLTIERLRFVEIEPGYFYAEPEHFVSAEGLISRALRSFGLQVSGTAPFAGWTEIDHHLWVLRTEVSTDDFLRFVPQARQRFSGSSHCGRAISATWRECHVFCDALSSRIGVISRLPKLVERRFVESITVPQCGPKERKGAASQAWVSGVWDSPFEWCIDENMEFASSVSMGNCWTGPSPAVRPYAWYDPRIDGGVLFPSTIYIRRGITPDSRFENVGFRVLLDLSATSQP